MKHCKQCDRVLSDDCFFKRNYPKTGRTGLQSCCKECQGINRNKCYKPHEYIRRKLKLSDEQYIELMKHEVCQACGQDFGKKKCIDHCHITEKVRGVLCHNCNTALGLIGDNVQTLSKLIQYLEQSELQ